MEVLFVVGAVLWRLDFLEMTSKLRFLNWMHDSVPVIFWHIFQIFLTLASSTVRDRNVNTSWLQNTMDFRKHVVYILFSITADNGIEACFIKDNVKSWVFELQISDVHLCKCHLIIFVLIFFLIKLNSGIAEIDAGNMLVTWFIKLFWKSWISTSNYQNLWIRLTILCNHILQLCWPICGIQPL